MKNKTRKFYKKHDQKINYIVAGTWNAIFAYTSFVALYFIAKPYHVSVIVVLIFNQVIAYTQAFIVNKLFVFKTRGNYLREYIRFYIVNGISFGANIVLIYIFVTLLHFNAIVSQGVILCILVIFSYAGHAKFSFRSKNNMQSENILSKD